MVGEHLLGGHPSAHSEAVPDAGGSMTGSIPAGLQELGDIEILDVTFCLEVECPSFEAKMAVYFSFPEETEAGSS